MVPYEGEGGVLWLRKGLSRVVLGKSTAASDSEYLGEGKAEVVVLVACTQLRRVVYQAIWTYCIMYQLNI